MDLLYSVIKSAAANCMKCWYFCTTVHGVISPNIVQSL